VADAWYWLAVAELTVVLVLLVRLGKGPTVCDRVVALNTISTQATLATLAVAVATGRSVYLDVSLWLCSFSYLGTLVWARYLERDLL
jgi:multicomponent Na+:H+ antiporter subunit F